MEMWKPIEGYEGLYEVSDMGRVKSFQRKEPFIMRQNTDRDGYKTIKLRNYGQRAWFVHRLVLLTFKGEPQDTFQGSHIDGDSTNNCLSNLIWESAVDNVARKKGHGTENCGERNWQSKLKAGDIYKIRALLMLKVKGTEIARIFKVNPPIISMIKKGKAWAHI